MKLRRLGNSPIELSPLGLGCWQFSKSKGFAGSFWPSLSDEETFNIIKSSLDAGVNWFDTAELYGWGKSEMSLSLALKKINQKNIFIATKWWPLFRTAKSIKSTISDRLSNLNGYPITLHQIHMPLGFSTIEKEMDAMADLVDEKKIKYIGVSNFNKKQMIRAHQALSKHGLHLVSNQVEYSILNRKIESDGVLQTAKELGVSIIAYSPLSQGMATGKFHDNPDLIKKMHLWRRSKRKHRNLSLSNSLPVINELRKIAKKHSASVSQIALSWLMNFHGDIVFVIPGARTVEQAVDNNYSMNISLSSLELETLNIVSEKFK